MQVEVISRATQAADGDEPIQSRIRQQQVVQPAQARGPSGVEPAQIYGQAQGEKNDRVAPVAVLLRVGHRRPRQEPRDRDRQEGE
jgi:hypothetical protein